MSPQNHYSILKGSTMITLKLLSFGKDSSKLTQLSLIAVHELAIDDSLKGHYPRPMWMCPIMLHGAKETKEKPPESLIPGQ